MSEFTKKYLIACVILFAFCLIMLPYGGHGSDVGLWEYWTNYIQSNGLGEIYNSNTDYLPLYHYILKVFGDIQGGDTVAVHDNIHYLKLITLLFDFIIGYFIARMVKRQEISWEKLLLNILMFYLLNIAILYNSLIWNQVDSILTCFALISCYFAFKKRITLSLVFLFLAINFKLQAIIFVPVIGLLLLPVAISTFSVKRLAQWILIPALLQFLIVLPFILAGTGEKLWDVVFNSVGKYPQVSMNAYNIWDIFLPGEDLMSMRDSEIFIGATYKNWGLYMFFIASTIALFPLAKAAFLAIVRKTEFHISMEKFLITCALIPLLFFFFNSQMHERYSHPAFAFLIAYSLYTKKPLVATIGCLAYLLNMEGVLRVLHLTTYNSMLIFDRTFIAYLFLFVIVLLCADLYNFNVRKKSKDDPSYLT